MVEIKIEFTGNLKQMPTKGSEHAAGYDIHADIIRTVELKHATMSLSERRRIEYIAVIPGKSILILAGFKMEIPVGYEAQVRPRSGLALKKQVTVGNSPGTIDADYRGEVGVIIQNNGNIPFLIEQGDRIAQMVINEVPKVVLIEKSVDGTERGSGGFGSTGK